MPHPRQFVIPAGQSSESKRGGSLKRAVTPSDVTYLRNLTVFTALCLVSAEGWVRPEDDLSTGFIFVQPSQTLHAFLDSFLEDPCLVIWYLGCCFTQLAARRCQENDLESLPGGLLRDPFDQRVFNKSGTRYPQPAAV